MIMKNGNYGQTGVSLLVCQVITWYVVLLCQVDASCEGYFASNFKFNASV